MLDTALLVAFLLGYLARYIPSEYYWWGEMIAVGLPYIAAVVVLVSIFVFISRALMLSVVHVLALILILLRFGSLGWLTQYRTTPGENITVLTYNVPGAWGQMKDSEREDRMLNTLRTIRPDLIAFQEVELVFQEGFPEFRSREQILAVRDSLGYQSISPRGDRVLKFVNQSVFAHGGLHEQRRILLDPPMGADIPTEITRTVLSLQGRRAVLYNVHLASHGRRKPWRARDVAFFSPQFWVPYLRQYRDAYVRRAWEAREISRMIRAETLPVIVCGDMNSTPHNWVFAQIKKAGNLTDAFRAGGRGWGATYHVRYPLVRIDHILVGPEFEVLSARVPSVKLSDHRPMSAIIRWRKSE